MKRLLGKSVQKYFWSVVATLIFAALVYFADFNDVLEAMSEANPLYVLAAAVFGLITLIVWSINWKNFFEISGINEGYLRSFQLHAASGFLNLVTPLGQFGGQPVMAYLVSKESDSSYEKSLATLSSADLIVIMPVAVFSMLGIMYMTVTGGLSSELIRMSMFVYLLALFGVFMGYLGWYKPKILKDILFKVFSKVDYLTGKESNLVNKIDDFLTTLEDSYREIGKDPRGIVRSMAIVHVAYISKFLAMLAVMMSLNIDISFFHVMLLVPLASVANFSPTPGSAGTFEAAMAGLILLFVNVPLAMAVTAAVLYRVSTFWVGILVGYIAMTSLGIDSEKYKKKAQSSL